MRSVLAVHQSRRTAKSLAGVSKSVDPRRPNKQLRSLDQYFWYTSPDGVVRLATSSDTLSEVPQQINDYVFDRTVFANHEHPSTILPGAIWPPRDVLDLLRAVGSEGEECVGSTCYTDTVCKDSQCRHTFEQLKSSTQNWRDHFELRKTDDRGIGVHTKRAFSKGDVLGWYAGEIIADTGNDSSSDYLMEMPIGVASRPPSVYSSDSEDLTSSPPPSSPSSYVAGDVTVLIDASRKGNWTRFINHSCDPHADFRMRRVGGMRIMVIEAMKDIPANVELSVSYGDEYYGRDTKKICYCGTEKCVSRFRKEKGMWAVEETKRKVKTCSRLMPPLE